METLKGLYGSSHLICLLHGIGVLHITGSASIETKHISALCDRFITAKIGAEAVKHHLAPALVRGGTGADQVNCLIPHGPASSAPLANSSQRMLVLPFLRGLPIRINTFLLIRLSFCYSTSGCCPSCAFHWHSVISIWVKDAVKEPSSALQA